jgi:hypothetical protein
VLATAHIDPFDQPRKLRYECQSNRKDVRRLSYLSGYIESWSKYRRNGAMRDITPGPEQDDGAYETAGNLICLPGVKLASIRPDGGEDPGPRSGVAFPIGRTPRPAGQLRGFSLHGRSTTENYVCFLLYLVVYQNRRDRCARLQELKAGSVFAFSRRSGSCRSRSR